VEVAGKGAGQIKAEELDSPLSRGAGVVIGAIPLAGAGATKGFFGGGEEGGGASGAGDEGLGVGGMVALGVGVDGRTGIDGSLVAVAVCARQAERKKLVKTTESNIGEIWRNRLHAQYCI
jgi:hypothetical protein